MKPELSTMKLIVWEAVQAARLIRAERPVQAAAKPVALGNMRRMRAQALMTDDEKRQHADMDAIHCIENALAEIQNDINAATADVSHAKTPEQRRKAENRLAKLMAQKRRLEIQLGQAKVRQLNKISIRSLRV